MRLLFTKYANKSGEFDHMPSRVTCQGFLRVSNYFFVLRAARANCLTFQTWVELSRDERVKITSTIKLKKHYQNLSAEGRKSYQLLSPRR